AALLVFGRQSREAATAGTPQRRGGLVQPPPPQRPLHISRTRISVSAARSLARPSTASLWRYASALPGAVATAMTKGPAVGTGVAVGGELDFGSPRGTRPWFAPRFGYSSSPRMRSRRPNWPGESRPPATRCPWPTAGRGPWKRPGG